ncbi:MAG: SUMF1/EgtB/PvdO family nonheme iron enzyme [Lachnotalea sp.]
MSRLLSGVFINKDPRAKLTVAKMATISDLVAPSAEYMTATGDTEVTLASDCVIAIGTTGVFKTDGAVISIANLDTGSSFTLGKDYYVYICDPGSEDLDEVYVISLNSTYPTGYTAANSRKLGGFHYGIVRCVSSKLNPINTGGTEKGSGWESNVKSAIVPRSVWTTHHRPKCSPEGMVYVSSGLWVDIYLASSNGIGGVQSVYNATPLTGTEGYNSYDFIDMGLKTGKRLLSYSEWQQAAYGSPQGEDGNNTNAWTATTNAARTATGIVVKSVSAIGCRDCVGNVMEWLDELSYRYDGTQSFSWKDVLGEKNGQIYTEGICGLTRLIAGGYWQHGVHAGCRTVTNDFAPWAGASAIGARFGCDSL